MSRSGAFLVTTAFVALVGLCLFIPGQPCDVGASSHREAPIISTDPSADNTDVYLFVSPDKPNTVTLIANYIPFEEPAGGPNFFKFSDDVRYAIHVDNIGDAQQDITFEFSFESQIINPNTFLYNVGAIGSPTDPNLNVQHTYTVTRVDDSGSTVLGSGLATAPTNVGPVSISDYGPLGDAAAHELGNDVMVFAGPRDDPFFVDLGAIFDLLGFRAGAPGNEGGGRDELSGYNCHTIALQVPIDQLTSDGSVPASSTDASAVIGAWATASRPAITTLQSDAAPTTSGDLVQVSRLGMPLVNEVVLPLSMKDLWNASKPEDDGQFLNFVTDPELGGLLNLLYGLSVPPAPRDDLVQVFLTGVPGLNQPPNVTASEQIRLNVAISPSEDPNPLGVIAGDNAGFPNGRRLEDDVTDIALRVVAGVLVGGFNISPNNLLGDGVDRNDRPFQSTFPYVAPPHQGFDHRHHRVEPPSPSVGASIRRARQDAFLTVALLESDGRAVAPGMSVEFSRSVSGRSPAYAWSGMADIQGLAEVTITASNARSANGLYAARLVDPATADILGTWSSIPVRAGQHTTLTLQIGNRARIGSAEATSSFGLKQNVPNPFNPETTIRFELPGPTEVRLTIYNTLGQVVRNLVIGPQAAGTHSVRWDGRDNPGNLVSSGLYFYTLETDGFSEIRKMLLVK